MTTLSAGFRIGAAAVLLTVATGANAADSALERGTHEFGIHLSPDLFGPVGDTLFLDVGYGVFVRDRLELRASASYTLLEDVVGPEKDYRAWDVAVGADYHLLLGRAVPFAGLFVGWHRINIDTGAESAMTWGPRLGLKYFLADNVALAFDAAYAQASKEVFFNDFELDDQDLVTSLGLRLMF
jgi:hypothetical protein